MDQEKKDTEQSNNEPWAETVVGGVPEMEEKSLDDKTDDIESELEETDSDSAQFQEELNELIDSEINSPNSELESLIAERDQYLQTSRRVQAEFENYRKQVGKREVESRERANEKLISELLSVLDACDGAVSNGIQDVEPIRSSLLETLTKQGLERIDTETEFDPEMHEAVMHDDGEGGPVVSEVLRAGYSWKGRVVRPAMVRVKG